MRRWIRAELGPRSRANRRTRSQNFDASAFAASAQRAAVVDAHVAALAGRAGVAVINAAVENNAGSDSGSNRGIENVAESARRAPARFGQRRGVRVIVDFDGQSIFARFSRPAENSASREDSED